MAQHFIDSTGALSNMRRTPQGGFLVDATLARVGVMGYSAGTDVLRRYNPASVLAAHAAEAAVAPVTFKHPKKFVDIHNFKDLVKGHVVGTPVFEDGHIKATLAIQDAELIRAIEMGAAREVSMGYTAHHDGKPGVTESGESYDEARVKIEWNHIAVVPAGRAGKTVRLMLDGEDIPDQESDEIMLKINGVVVSGESVQASFDAYDADLQAQIADLTKQVDELKADKTKLESELKVAQSDAALDERIEKKLAAQKAADEAKAKIERVKAKYPTINLDGKSQDFIDGLDARIEAEVQKDAEGLNKIESKDKGGKPVEDAADKKPKVKKLTARERMIAELKNPVKAVDGADAE